MLGRQPEEMVHMDMHDIMPQPFGLMHPKWMKDQEQRPTRPPPSSCRAGVVQTLLSANGAHVHARLKMSIREVGDNFSHIVKAKKVLLGKYLLTAGCNCTSMSRAEKVLPDEYLADRCLHLHVNELGQIVWASKTPKVLFNFEGESCVGKSVFDIVDVLQAWQAEGEGQGVPTRVHTCLAYSRLSAPLYAHLCRHQTTGGTGVGEGQGMPRQWHSSFMISCIYVGNDPLEALGAFLIQSLDHPGSTWRVSIVPQLSKVRT
eukprot:scaffold114924_cov22-Tisochrysis_lutea.AAC.1